MSRLVNGKLSWNVSTLKVVCLCVSLFIYLFDTHKLMKPYLTKVKSPEVGYEDMKKLDQNVSLNFLTIFLMKYLAL